MAQQYTAALKAEYERLWASCEIDYERSVADSAASRLLKNKGRYQQVEALTGVPWFWIAIIHEREASGSFAGVLHNGEHILGTGRKTKLVPAGRGPFNTWEEAAVDALALKGLTKGVQWDVGRFWYEAERFNGFGYRVKNVPTPYLWSHTNHYKDYNGDAGDPGGGKYVADHVYDPSVHDKQLGCAAVLIALMAKDPSITFGQRPVQPEKQADTVKEPIEAPPKPAQEEVPHPSTSAPQRHLSGATKTGAGLGVGTAVALLFSSYWWLVVLAIALGGGYWLWRKSKSEEPQEEGSPNSGSDKSRPTKRIEREERRNSREPSGPETDGKSPTE